MSELGTSALFAREWIQQGVEQGREEGRRSALLDAVMLLTQQRFGGLSEEVKEQIRHLSGTQLETLLKKLLDFQDLVALDAWLHENESSPDGLG